MTAVSSEYRVVRLHRDIDGGFTFEGQFDFKSTVPQPRDLSRGVDDRKIRLLPFLKEGDSEINSE